MVYSARLPAAREVEPEMGALRPTVAMMSGSRRARSDKGYRNCRNYHHRNKPDLVVRHPVLVAQLRSLEPARPGRERPGHRRNDGRQRLNQPSLGMQPPGRGAGLAPIRPPGGGGGGPLAPVGRPAPDVAQAGGWRGPFPTHSR